VAFLDTLFALLMVTKIIVIVSTFTTEVAATVKPSLRQSDRAAGDSRENDESYCESGCADQFGSPMRFGERQASLTMALFNCALAVLRTFLFVLTRPGEIAVAAPKEFCSMERRPRRKIFS